MKDWKLEIGNSSTGPIGLVAYTWAVNKRQALQKFREEIGETIEVKIGRYYQNIHLNPKAIRMSMITEVVE